MRSGSSRSGEPPAAFLSVRSLFGVDPLTLFSLRFDCSPTVKAPVSGFSRCSLVVRLGLRSGFRCRRGHYNHSLHLFGSGSAFSEILPIGEDLPYKCIKYTCQVYHKCIFFAVLHFQKTTYLRGFSLFKCIKCIIFLYVYRNVYIFFSPLPSPLSLIYYL